MKHSVCILASAMTCAAFAAPVIPTGSVTVVQDSSRAVSIGYVLEGDPAIVTVDVLTNGVSIGDQYLQRVAGDVNELVQPGSHKISWRPDLDWPGHVFKNGEVSVRVKAWATNNPPAYLVVDLRTDKGRFYYPSADAVPGGVHDDRYKRDYMLLRRIPAANVRWRMGAPEDELKIVTGDQSLPPIASETPHYVTLTEDYYMGVFEVTMAQYGAAMGDALLTSLLPAQPVIYSNLRGATTGPDVTSKEALHTLPDPNDSMLGMMRKKTGVQFDLPTDAQWEYAYRAGTCTAYYTGNDWRAALSAMYVQESEPHGGEFEPQKGGLLLPNAFGLYDMAGNMWEWTLDEYNVNPCAPAEAGAEVVDPVGVNTGSSNGIIRGGSMQNTGWQDGRAARRETVTRDFKFNTIGCRVCCPVTLF